MLKVHSFETFGTHEGPGIRLVVFLQGCLFRCKYCHNPDTQDLEAGLEVTTEQILSKAQAEKVFFKNKGGVTFSGGEPTFQARQLLPIIQALQQAGFHIALDTNGGIYNTWVEQIYETIDLVLLDIKHIDNDQHIQLTGHTNLNTLKLAKFREDTGRPMWLRLVLVPGINDQPEYLHRWGQAFKNYKAVQRVEILPYHELGKYKYQELNLPYQLEGIKPPTLDEVKKAQQILEIYFGKKVFIR